MKHNLIYSSQQSCSYCCGVSFITDGEDLGTGGDKLSVSVFQLAGDRVQISLKVAQMVKNLPALWETWV